MRQALRITLLSGAMISALGAATVNLTQKSVNDVNGSVISAVNKSQFLESGLTYETLLAPSGYSSYKFSYWTNSSYPTAEYRDPWGRSENPISFVLLENTTATAHYLPSTHDSDGDQLPDWYELQFFGDLTSVGSDDGDGDSVTLLSEYNGGTHPLYGNASSPGGVSSSLSALISVDLAGNPTYNLRSVPAGLINLTETVIPGTSITSPDLSNNAAFGYWTLNGVRQTDPWGVSLPVISFTVQLNPMEGVAYLFTGDSDNDNLADAQEYYFFGSLEANAGSDDPDNDGRTIAEEIAAGSAPHLANAADAGGVVWADSAMVSINLANFASYSITSQPAGVYNEQGSVDVETSITTPLASADNFAYWTVDGVRQEDPWGIAIRQASFVVNGEDRHAVAHFVEGDSDSDGLPDAYELFYFGNLEQTAEDDPDNDGESLLAEFTSGAHPRFATSSEPGAIFWTDSELLVANLQPYTRGRFALVDGVLTEFFSPDPHVVTGASASSATAVAVTDWDGDGDFDVFIALADGLSLLQNIGSANNPNFLEITPPSSLASLIAAIDQPVIAGGDWNHDGLGDLVIGGNTGVLQLVPSISDFDGIGSVQTLDTGASRAYPALGDFSGDGVDDLLVLLDDGSVRYYVNQNATPPFVGYSNDYLGQPIDNAVSFGVGDIDQDGQLDVLAADQDGRIWEFIQTAGAFTLKSKVWGGSHEGFASGLTLAPVDLEQDGDLDLIAGLANGGLINLRDPRSGRPTGLRAASGADSILLSWNADWQSRIAGYFLYRAQDIAEPFLNLVDEPQTLPTYRDFDVSPGQPLHYVVTAVSRYYIAGNSEPRIVESLPSDIASATAGRVELSLRPIRGLPNQKVKVYLAIENSLGLSGEGLSISVEYDPTVLTPLAQHDGSASVRSTPLSGNVAFTDNGATADGLLNITGSGGEIRAGSGKLFVLEFFVSEAASLGEETTLSIASATLFSNSGFETDVILNQPADLLLAAEHQLGDINGDGVVDANDETALLAHTRNNAPPPGEEALLAGDLNGDGELSVPDLILLKRLLRGLPID